MEKWRPKRRAYPTAILPLESMPPSDMLGRMMTAERLDRWGSAVVMLCALYDNTVKSTHRKTAAACAKEAREYLKYGNDNGAAESLRTSLWMMADTGVPDDVLFDTFFSIFTDGGNNGGNNGGMETEGAS